MRIFQLTIENIEVYKKAIIDMLKQSFEISFPHQQSDSFSMNEKFQSLKRYMEGGKALVYASEVDGRLAGFVWFFEKVKNNISSLHINHFVVDQQFRRRGIGSALWKEVESYAHRNEIEEIDLFVSKDNEDAIRFYSNQNFEVDRFVMKKRLFK